MRRTNWNKECRVSQNGGQHASEAAAINGQGAGVGHEVGGGGCCSQRAGGNENERGEQETREQKPRLSPAGEEKKRAMLVLGSRERMKRRKKRVEREACEPGKGRNWDQMLVMTRRGLSTAAAGDGLQVHASGRAWAAGH